MQLSIAKKIVSYDCHSRAIVCSSMNYGEAISAAVKFGIVTNADLCGDAETLFGDDRQPQSERDREEYQKDHEQLILFPLFTIRFCVIVYTRPLEVL